MTTSRSKEFQEGLKPLPTAVRPYFEEVMKDPYMNDALLAMMRRQTEFSSPTAAMMAGVYMNPIAREFIDSEIDLWWDVNTPQMNVGRTTRDVVVGSGIHAAIYASVRHITGGAKPLVFERNIRPGGIFAVSMKPSFYLNSRNRPGDIGLPGTDSSLNYIPGGPVQPSDLGGGEYQTNTEMAWCVRMALLCHAEVGVGIEASTAGVGASVTLRKTGRPNKANNRDATLTPPRLVWATGIGVPNISSIIPEVIGASSVLTFNQLMAKMDEPFPFRTMGRRIAVIGGGDSGRTAIEALTGQGPSMGWSSASLDYLDEIDWYGVQNAGSRAVWEECNRSRFKGIGRMIANGRVKGFPNKVKLITKGYKCIYLDGIPYDTVVLCIGYRPEVSVYSYADVGGRSVASFGPNSSGKSYLVGPAAQLPLAGEELTSDLYRITGAPVGIFRYAPRTAALAESFGVIEETKEVRPAF